MKILEWSDTQLKFHITETENSCGCNDGTATEVDLSEYDKIVLEVRYNNGVVEYEWTVVTEWEWQNAMHYVVFEILSESTIGRIGVINCDIWWIKDDAKVRFNEHTIVGEILPSIVIPQWSANE